MASKPLFLSLLTFSALSSLGALLWTSNNLYGRQSAKTDVSAVEIIEKITGEGATKIRFRNTSNKNINALQVSVNGLFL